MSDLYKYGVAVHLYKPIIKRGVVDFAVSADWTPAAGDVKISKDGGAAANVTNLPSAITMGNTAMWDYSLTATEMQAAKVRITVSDSATKAVEDTMFEIDTYGNASAQHAIDLNDAVRAGLTALPNAAAAAAGGLMVLGVNATLTSFTAGFVMSNAGGDALQLTSSGSNGSGLNASGNGTGAGIKGTGGATGNGMQAVGGATSGSAVKFTGTAGNAIGLEVAGQGSASGIQSNGGATGIGILINGGGTSGEGLFIATSNGDGIRIAPIGASKHGIRVTGGSSGTSDGINVTAGTGGVAIRADITGTITTVTNLTTNNDKAGYALSSAGVQAVWDALTSAMTTVGSVGKRIADFLTGDAYTRLGAPAGASISADIAAVKVDTAAVKVQTDKLAFTVTNQVDANVLDWKSSTAPAMTGDAFARLGAPAGASVSADVAGVKSDTAAVKTATNTGVAPGASSGLAIVGSTMAITSNVKKNQALAKFEFLMTDSTNHNPVTGKTVTVTRSIDGAAFASGALSAVTEVGNGMYYVDFAAGDLNGNVITLRATATGCDDTFERVVTQP